MWLVTGENIEAVEPDWVAGQPSFAPDDQSLVVVRAEGDYESSGPRATELWVVPLDDGESRQLTSGGFAGAPDWHAATNSIVYAASSVDAGEVRVIDGDGGAPRTVLAAEGHVDSPRWSPSGEEIAFVELVLSDDLTTRTTTVHVITAEGEAVRSFEVPEAWTVSWHPDGGTLLVSTYEGEDGATFELDLEAGEQRELAQGMTMATWSSDGDTVFFLDEEGAAGPGVWRLARGHVDDGELVRDAFIGDDSLYGYPYYGMATPHCASS